MYFPPEFSWHYYVVVHPLTQCFQKQTYHLPKYVLPDEFPIPCDQYHCPSLPRSESASLDHALPSISRSVSSSSFFQFSPKMPLAHFLLSRHWGLLDVPIKVPYITSSCSYESCFAHLACDPLISASITQGWTARPPLVVFIILSQ